MLRQGRIISRLAELNSGSDDQSASENGARFHNLKVCLTGGAVVVVFIIGVHFAVVCKGDGPQAGLLRAFAKVHRGVVAVRRVIRVRMHIHAFFIFCQDKSPLCPEFGLFRIFLCRS